MVGSHLDITARKRAEQVSLKQVSQLMAAQRIQEHLLPRKAPNIPGLEIAGSLIPAEFAAGDYFDYLKLPDGSLLVIVGDVAGQGFSSALVMAATSAHLRSFIQHHEDIQKILEYTNSIMCKELEETRFVTLFMLHLQRDCRTFNFINAGHPSGIVIDHAGNVKQELRSNAMPLAVTLDAEFPLSGPGWLAPGDSVILTTDGISEARNPSGEFFGTDRLLDVIRRNLSRRPQEIISCLQESATQFTGRPHPEDDITIVIIRAETDQVAADGESPATAGRLGA
jgi:sigma-B regulation protein RsbU (phosphoserine phosphatase)